MKVNNLMKFKNKQTKMHKNTVENLKMNLK